MKEFDRLVKIVKKLRKECPWDRRQTHKSLRPYMLEETNEAIEAINKRDYIQLAEELGDQLLHILMHAEISKTFTVKDIIRHITEKMVRRHPHVFAKKKVRGVKDVLRNWEAIKKKEDRTRQSGVKLRRNEK
ncbi:MazG nucleotide pyrophosphohydrolase domain-containing protein [Candidatus Margulisiibacteriota bacterium]